MKQDGSSVSRTLESKRFVHPAETEQFAVFWLPTHNPFEIVQAKTEAGERADALPNALGERTGRGALSFFTVLFLLKNLDFCPPGFYHESRIKEGGHRCI